MKKKIESVPCMPTHHHFSLVVLVCLAFPCRSIKATLREGGVMVGIQSHVSSEGRVVVLKGVREWAIFGIDVLTYLKDKFN